jgi:hypothetical protein
MLKMMRLPQKLSLLLAVLAIALVPETFAQQVGNCNPAVGEAYLDINNVRA